MKHILKVERLLHLGHPVSVYIEKIFNTVTVTVQDNLSHYAFILPPLLQMFLSKNKI